MGSELWSSGLVSRQNTWLVDWLTDWWVDRLTGWTDCLLNWRMDCLIDWLADLTAWLTDVNGLQTHGRQNGNTLSTEGAQRTADQSHPWHAASTTQQAAVASSRHGEGGGGIQKLPTRWPCPQNQGHDAVSGRSWSRGWTWGWWLPFFDRTKNMRGLGLMQRLPLPVLPFRRLNAWCAWGEMTWKKWSDKSE